MRLALIALPLLVATCVSTAARADADDWKGKLLAEINRVRLAGATCLGRWHPSASPLSREDSLGKAAQIHADDMRRRRYFSHVSLENQGPFQRIATSGYAYSLAAEAIAGGVAEPRKVVALWLKSGDSCDAMMNPKFRDLGLGLGLDKASPLRVWWVAAFGKKAL